VETALQTYDDDDEWDMGLLAQDLMMHYLITIPVVSDPRAGGATLESIRDGAVAAGRAAFDSKMKSLGEHADRVLSLVMLNVLDEKWKDHLYDLDQLRGAIHYRSWGQKDPLIEYKQEAYTMFVDLMSDISHTFAERFLRVQLMPNPQVAAPPPPQAPTKRFNAMGVLEEVVAGGDGGAESGRAESGRAGLGGDQGRVADAGQQRTEAPDTGAAAPPPRLVGPGMGRGGQGTAGAIGAGASVPKEWGNVGRNDPCPCGSGKKFKKCHGAA
jgi:preprotein translocase subunit SecA